MIKGALILSVGGVLTKLLGAIYRIPLTNLLGAKGIGLYQMVFPLYSVLLTFSSTGVPAGISKLIAEGKDGKEVLKTSLKFFTTVGLILTLVMAVFANKLALLQGDKNAGVCYSLLAPSVFIVSAISCFRGYYQGFSNMKPTAISQILEQTVKLSVGLLLCFLIKGDAVVMASLAVLAVTISEGVTLIYFIVKSRAATSLLNVKVTDYSFVYKTVIPMIAVTLIIPLIRTLDSFLIINILKGYLSNATELYGLLTGAVESLISMPVAVCYALSITSIPVISRLKKSGENFDKKTVLTLGLTLTLSVIFAVLVYLFSGFAVRVLYGGLSSENKSLLVKMLKTSSITVVSLSFYQSSVAIANALGKFKVSLKSGIVGGVIKIIITVILLQNPKINIFGAIYGDIFCYLVASFLNLRYIINNDSKTKVEYERNNRCGARG